MEFSYPLEEWMVHCADFAKLTHYIQNPYHAAIRFFSKRFPNPEEADYKRARFVAAMKFLEAYREEFNEEAFAVTGEDSWIVTDHLFVAVWTIFYDRTDKEIDDPIDVETVKFLAREAKQMWNAISKR